MTVIECAVSLKVHQLCDRLILRYLSNSLEWRLREYLIWKCFTIFCHISNSTFLTIPGREGGERKGIKMFIALKWVFFFVYFWNCFFFPHKNYLFTLKINLPPSIPVTHLCPLGYHHVRNSSSTTCGALRFLNILLWQ